MSWWDFQTIFHRSNFHRSNDVFENCFLKTAVYKFSKYIIRGDKYNSLQTFAKTCKGILLQSRLTLYRGHSQETHVEAAAGYFQNTASGGNRVLLKLNWFPWQVQNSYISEQFILHCTKNEVYH